MAAEVNPSSSSAWFGRSRDALADAANFDRAFLSRWDGVFLMDQLLPFHVAEVACLQLCRYWREYGIEVGYAEPELILDAVQRNQDFAEYGVPPIGSIHPGKNRTGDSRSKTQRLDKSESARQQP